MWTTIDSLVGEVGFEPTVFLMYLIYSQARSPTTHTHPNRIIE